MKWADISSYRLLYNSLLNSKYHQEDILYCKIYETGPVFKELKYQLSFIKILDDDIKKLIWFFIHYYGKKSIILLEGNKCREYFSTLIQTVEINYTSFNKSLILVEDCLGTVKRIWI